MICIIGGSGLETIGKPLNQKVVDTPYGDVTIETLSVKNKDFIFLSRHGSNHQTPPHKINYRANIWALKKCNVKQILATAAVGSLKLSFKPGMFGLVSQFMDFTKNRESTFFDSFEKGLQHTDMSTPYSQNMNLLLERALLKFSLPYESNLVMVVTEGPRFETSAEIKAFTILGGDIIGMTGYPEVALANELSIPYSCLAICSNFAAGIINKPLSHEEVILTIQQSKENIKSILAHTVENSFC